MLEILVTVEPTNATSFFRETSSASTTNFNTYFDEFSESNSTSSKNENEESHGPRSTTYSESAAGTTAQTIIYVGEDADVYTTNTAASGYTTESWNGAFTYQRQEDGASKTIVGVPENAVVEIQTTTSESFTFFGRTTTTRTSSTLTASYGSVIATASIETTVDTTTFDSITHSRKTLTEATETRITAYTATDTEVGASYYRTPAYEYATVLVPQENEVLWVLTAAADGILSSIATSYTDSTTIYPAKEFFQAGVYGTTFDPATGYSTITSTTYGSGAQNNSSALRAYAGIIPANVSTGSVFGISTQTGTATFQVITQGFGSSFSSTRTISTSIAENIAGSNYTTTQITTATTNQWEATYFVTSSESFTTSTSQEISDIGSGSESSAWRSANTAEGQWSRESAHFYQAAPRTPTQAGRSYRAAWFALNSATDAASLLSVNNMTLSIPTTLQANQLVVGVWPTSWSYVSNSTSVTASAWAGGVSATSISSGSSATETTTSGSWATIGTPVTAASTALSRVADGGLQKTGTATVLVGQGTYYTFDSAGGTGTQLLSGSSTVGSYLGILTAQNFLRGGAVRYTSAQRNFTALPT
jgi:hypothetical protein